MRFVFHPSLRYSRRIIRRKLALIREFSDARVGQACGRQAEILFSRALLARGFELIGENVREYEGQSWTLSGHNLDFIVRRDGIGYGCEVKNRFEYIERDELRTKMEMCRHLGVRPLFILRYAPKSYIDEIQRAGGYAMIFVTHIYPFGFDRLVDAIRREFPELPVDCPRDLPDTILVRFARWHERRLAGERQSRDEPGV